MGGPKKPSTAPPGREKTEAGLGSSKAMAERSASALRIAERVLSKDAAMKREEARKIAEQRRAPSKTELSDIARAAAMKGAVSTVTDWRMDLPGVERSVIDPMRRPWPGGGGNPTHSALGGEASTALFGHTTTSIWTEASTQGSNAGLGGHASGVPGPSPNQTQASWGCYSGDSMRSSGSQRGSRRSWSPGRFRQRGFGVASKETSFLLSGRGSAEALGPGQYPIATGDTTLWRHDLASNKVQQFLSQHKSPKLCSFTSGSQSAKPALGFHEVPGPGHYSMPTLWGDSKKGTCFGHPTKTKTKGDFEVESRFGMMVDAAKDLQ